MKDKKKGFAILIVIVLLLVRLVSCNALTDHKRKDKNEIVETPKGNETEKNPQDEEKDNLDDKVEDKDKGSQSDQPLKEEDKPSKPVDKPTQPEDKPVTPPNNNGDNNKPSKPNNPQPTPDPKPEEPNKPAHSHDYQPVYKTVYHEAEGYYEKIKVKDAWDEDIYEERYVQYCNDCGTLFKIMNPDGSFTRVMSDTEMENHLNEHTLGDGSGAYTSDYKTIKVGTKHHDAVYENKWVVDKEAWDEQVLDYYQCSCGKKK